MIRDYRTGIIFSIIVLAIGIALIVDPVAQDPAYHHFVDTRTLLGIPNFWNVVSNLPFPIVGALGMWLLMSGRAQGGLAELHTVYLVFFSGVFLTGFGSGYYHLAPTNATLVWDRLPMTILFMAIFCVLIGEHISYTAARRLLWPLIILGIASIYYWHVTETAGQGDLRPYGLVQFVPMLMIPLILLLYPSRTGNTPYLWGLIGFYALSKLAEFFDAELYAMGTLLSGHSLKHLLGAVGAYMLYLALIRPKPVVSP